MIHPTPHPSPHPAPAAPQARVAIVGAAGYSGAELCAILLNHPRARIVGLFGSGKAESEGKAPPLYSTVFPSFRARLDLPVLATDAAAIAHLAPDVVFLCTPHEASLDLVAKLTSLTNTAPRTIIDLSAAFRLKDASAYPAFYSFTHTHQHLLARAVYGLPELFRSAIRTASLIAAPGCYPTSAILPLAPLVRAGALARDSHGAPRRPIIDSTSGVSGAGRKPEQRLLFCEVSQQAYGVFRHRHQPEIDAYAGTPTLFTPHLGPFDRGILSTIHADLAPGWDEARVRTTLHDAYDNEPFVRLCPPNVWPAVADVQRTNFCDIALAVQPAHASRPAHAILSSAIDNLTKGAAGQAVQCMNIRLGYPETLGLLAQPASQHAEGQ
jgi:N-acetyl-gamma-glutamyl-phosphate reductase